MIRHHIAEDIGALSGEVDAGPRPGVGWRKSKVEGDQRGSDRPFGFQVEIDIVRIRIENTRTRLGIGPLERPLDFDAAVTENDPFPCVCRSFNDFKPSTLVPNQENPVQMETFFDRVEEKAVVK